MLYTNSATPTSAGITPQRYGEVAPLPVMDRITPTVDPARGLGAETAETTLPQLHLAAGASRPLEQAGWVVAALAISVGSWLLSRRLAR